MVMSPRLMKPVASGPTYHPESLTWRTAALANGGTGITASTMQAVSDFCTAIDAAGIRSNFLRLSLMCGGNLAAARTPLYRASSPSGTQYGAAIDANVGPFVPANYTEATGLAGDGTSKLLDTGLTIGALTVIAGEYNNIHVSVYQRVVGEGASFGGQDYDAAVYGNSCLFDPSTNHTGVDPYFHTGSANSGEGVEFTGSYALTGLHLVQNGSPGNFWLVNNSNNLANATSNAPVAWDSSDNTPIYALAAYSNYNSGEGMVDNPYYSSGTLAAYSVGIPIAYSGGRTAFYNAMIAFQTALGRNV
jgi:hypothetical protein